MNVPAKRELAAQLALRHPSELEARYLAARCRASLLEAMFDFYFVQPERTRVQREAVNAKLAEAGKPALKNASS